MKNIKKYLNSINTGILTTIALDGYRRTIKNDQSNKETDNIIQETVRKSQEIINSLNDTIEQEMINNVNINAQLGRIKESLDEIENNAKFLNNLGNSNNENTLNIENNQTLIKESSKSLKESASNANNLIDKLLDFINNNSSDNSNNFINNLYDNFYNIINSCNSIQLGAISHILVCIFIFFCLSNILTAYYGDKLIIYLNLENKWPKLAKFIQLRRKFQDYHIGINALLIISMLIFVIYINLSVLSYTL